MPWIEMNQADTLWRKVILLERYHTHVVRVKNVDLPGKRCHHVERREKEPDFDAAAIAMEARLSHSQQTCSFSEQFLLP
jgi:hypothetical protein